MSALNVAFLWHMHQPYYRNQLTGQYMLPWVLLHGTKDYLHMPRVLESFPAIHQTFNLVPSLMQQLLDYASGQASDRCMQLTRKPPAELTDDEKRYLLEFFFSINFDTAVARYPRYVELWEQRAASQADPSVLDEQFWRDAAGWFNLAWIDPTLLQADPVLQALSERQHFGPQDIATLQAKQLELLGAILPTYARLRDAGQIEICCSPYYHPILPLLVDSCSAAQEAHPGVILPSQAFRHPEDAAEQIRRAAMLHQDVLGQRPRGLWPSEGSVSQAMIHPLAQAGITWIASDEEVLSRSLGAALRGPEGALFDPAALYSAYQVEDAGQRLAVLFRDRGLADLIGFRYQTWQPLDAVRDLIGRLHTIHDALGSAAGNHIVPLILDGENCWEFYVNNGQDFLTALYDQLSHDSEVRCVTVSEFLAEHPPQRTLPRLASGSWIGGTFDVWIGEAAQNTAWDYLARTRDDLANWEGGDLAVLEQAWEQVYIAEGSDWFWWYFSGNDPKPERGFDRQFRTHLANVYTLMGSPVPPYLSEPILR
ncbi:MAG: hypothetical protein ACRDHX_01810 [Chloroflexota bacterium]